MRGGAARAAIIVMLLCQPALGDAGFLTVNGRVDHPLQLSVSDLAALPAVEFDATFETSHGAQTARYKGTLLWSLIEKAGLSVEPGKKQSALHHYLMVTGRDGYQVAVSIGEIDPNFEGKHVILAYTRDGKSLDSNAVELVVPGDKHAGRSVRDVIQVEVK